jgi:hypothetical protein
MLPQQREMNYHNTEQLLRTHKWVPSYMGHSVLTCHLCLRPPGGTLPVSCLTETVCSYLNSPTRSTGVAYLILIDLTDHRGRVVNAPASS